MPRLFTALEMPDAVKASLSMLRGGLPGARWIDVESFHLTLRFIGDVDERTADAVAEALGHIDRPAFDLALDGAGAFGSRRPHSVYAGVAQSPALRDLQADHERTLQRAGLEPEKRKFMPHVTLARLRNAREADVAAYLALRGGFRTATFPVRRFVLMSSRASTGGGPYVTEASYPLTA